MELRPTTFLRWSTIHLYMLPFRIPYYNKPDLSGKFLWDLNSYEIDWISFVCFGGPNSRPSHKTSPNVKSYVIVILTHVLVLRNSSSPKQRSDIMDCYVRRRRIYSMQDKIMLAWPPPGINLYPPGANAMSDCVWDRDHFGLFPEYFLQRLPENQVVLPECKLHSLPINALTLILITEWQTRRPIAIPLY